MTTKKTILAIVIAVLSVFLVVAVSAQVLSSFGDKTEPPSDDSSATPETPAEDELSFSEANALLSETVRFGGYEEVDGDSVRWIYEVDRQKLDTLEGAGYSVSFGSLFSLCGIDDETYNTASPTVTFSDDRGFVPEGNQTTLVYVHDTNGRYYPTNTYLEVTEDTYVFTYKLGGFSDRQGTFKVESRAFASLNYSAPVYIEGGVRTIVGGGNTETENPNMPLSIAKELLCGMITFRTFEALDEDSARWLFEVDRTILQELENAGYTVSFGAATTVLTMSGNTVNTAPSAVVYDELGGFKTSAKGATAVLVHDTKGNYSPSELFTASDGDKLYFSYKITGLADYSSAFTVHCRAFASLDYGEVIYTEGTQEEILAGSSVSYADAQMMLTTAISFYAYETVSTDSVRWLYTVDKAKIKALEDAGYIVSYGTLFMLRSLNGTVINQESPSVTFTESGGFATAKNASLALVHDTNGSYSPTNKYLSESDSYYTVSYRMNGFDSQTGVYVLESRMFATLNYKDTVYFNGGTQEVKGNGLTAADAEREAASLLKFAQYEVVDSNVVRWVYTVDRAKLEDLEDRGYNVSFGSVFSIRTLNDKTYNTTSPTVSYSENGGFTASLPHTSVALIHDSNGKGSPTNIYLAISGTTKTFSYALSGLSTKTDVYGVECRAFVALDYKVVGYADGGVKTVAGGAASSRSLVLPATSLTNAAGTPCATATADIATYNRFSVTLSEPGIYKIALRYASGYAYTEKPDYLRLSAKGYGDETSAWACGANGGDGYSEQCFYRYLAAGTHELSLTLWRDDGGAVSRHTVSGVRVDKVADVDRLLSMSGVSYTKVRDTAIGMSQGVLDDGSVMLRSDFETGKYDYLTFSFTPSATGNYSVGLFAAMGVADAFTMTVSANDGSASRIRVVSRSDMQEHDITSYGSVFYDDLTFDMKQNVKYTFRLSITQGDSIGWMRLSNISVCYLG